jgi:hypothetical protein
MWVGRLVRAAETPDPSTRQKGIWTVVPAYGEAPWVRRRTIRRGSPEHVDEARSLSSQRRHWSAPTNPTNSAINGLTAVAATLSQDGIEPVSRSSIARCPRR